jgi:DNA-binding CsgD family transcriptional regulator
MSSHLAPTQAEVAALAAAGRTNREIAEALGLAVKTVERHLARVYRKLGIRSRNELAARLAGSPVVPAAHEPVAREGREVEPSGGLKARARHANDPASRGRGRFERSTS